MQLFQTALPRGFAGLCLPLFLTTDPFPFRFVAEGKDFFSGRFHSMRRICLLMGFSYLTGFGFAALSMSPMGNPDSGILDQRLAREVKANGFPSLSVGIVQGERVVYAKSFGWADLEEKREATPATIYRIGSITKVFTTTLLAILRDEGVLGLDDPIAKYLPREVVLPSDPAGAPAITLRHLATHTSGLPRLPVNLQPKEGDPFGDYSVALLYQGLPKTKLVHPIEHQMLYSNLGMGLLGHVLELATGEDYASLLRSRILHPLGMSATTTHPEGPAFAKGYLGGSPPRVAKVWHLGVIAPAGVLGSNVRDMLRFLSLHLRAGEAGVTPIRASTLAELHRPQRVLDRWKSAVGLGWIIEHGEDYGDIVWHNGGLDGFHSHSAFSAAQGVGIVVLSNADKSVDTIGQWLIRRAVDLFGESKPTPIHEGAKATAQKLAAYFVAEPGDDVGKLFHPEFLKKIPLTRIKPILAAQFQKFGASRGIEKLKATEVPNRIEVLFKFENGTRKCLVEVDSADPPRIVYLLFPSQ